MNAAALLVSLIFVSAVSAQLGIFDLQANDDTKLIGTTECVHPPPFPVSLAWMHTNGQEPPALCT